MMPGRADISAAANVLLKVVDLFPAIRMRVTVIPDLLLRCVTTTAGSLGGAEHRGNMVCQAKEYIDDGLRTRC